MLQFKVDTDTCIQCGECAKDCPYMVIEMGEDGFPRAIADREGQCIQCQHCMTICKPGSLSILGKDPADSLPLKGNLPSQQQMETLVMGRRSVRRYKDEPVDSDVIARMLEISAHAPTGVNNRGVLFTVVDDAEVMTKVRTRTMEGLGLAVREGKLPEGLEFMADFVRLWEDKGVDVLFRGAPHLLVASSPKSGPCPDVDCHIAMTNFELLAASMGLGALWDGLFKWALTMILPDLMKDLGIPEDHKVGYAMVFGKPAVKYHRTVQRSDAKVNRVTAI
ncbi:nitroreductase family protein [Desulfovibrio ferrophilus]|uniref:Nitroreductase n=1 Tax=Desulfovibrio ferrophilus TaxID=241368 RepID=A0A2Z6B384_9BACT|nr:nitroreductase family protein [Desulfovibrio ferrophilus]BBD09876.1 nitroreductase [Desulfovibrio ferrophilus]